MQPIGRTHSKGQSRGATQHVPHARPATRALREHVRSRVRRGLFASIIVASLLVVLAPAAGAAHAGHPDMLVRGAPTPTWTLTADLTPILVWPSAGDSAAPWTLLVDLTPIQVLR